MQFDIVVVGGGLVGTSAAISLGMQGFKVCLVEAGNMGSAASNQAQWDSRIYAVTPGNVAWLKQLGAWEKLDTSRISPVRKMQVWGDESDGPLVFDAYEANTENLGVILESGLLQQALWSRLAALKVHLETAAKICQLQYLPDRVLLHLQSGKILDAKLLIAADGDNSWVRQQSGIGTQTHTYDQVGVVANFETELPHQGIARQWFGQDGILAWLPMPGNRISMVWSTSLSEELMTLSAEALADRVAEAGRNTLGKFKTITSAAAFALKMQTADSLVLPRLALVGDAAHRIHPLAGQGVNLGFRGAISLVRILSERHSFQDIGDVILLRRYERERRTDMLAMKHMTHGLQMLFASEQPAVKKLRNWGLALTNQQAMLKKYLIKQAII